MIDLDDLLTTLTAELEGDAEFAAARALALPPPARRRGPGPQPARSTACCTPSSSDASRPVPRGRPGSGDLRVQRLRPRLLTEVDGHLPGIEVIRLPDQPSLHPPDRHRRRSTSWPPRGPAGHRRSRRAVEPGAGRARCVAADEHDEAERVATMVRRTVRRRCCVRAGSRCSPAPTSSSPACAGRSSAPASRCSAIPRPPGRRSPRRSGRSAQLTSASQLRAWAHDVIDVPPPTRAQPVPPAVADERRVAAAVLDYLREAPLGDGAGFRSWTASTNPFAEAGDGAGAALLTFHAAKGREWHTVVVTGVETGLVPHRSATTGEAGPRRPDSSTSRSPGPPTALVITRAERRRGYARQASPFVAGLRRGAGPAGAGDAGRRGPTGASRRRRRRAPRARPHRLADGVARRRGPSQLAPAPPDLLRRRVVGHRRDAPDRRPHELSAITGFGPISAAPALRVDPRRPRRRRPDRRGRVGSVAQVDDDGCVVARQLALAGVAVDHRPLDPVGDRRRGQHEVDAQAAALVEVTAPGSPTTSTRPSASG